LDEVVLTAVTTLADGSTNFVELAKIKADAKVRSHFRRVLFKPPWDDTTWAMFFQSRPTAWEYDERLLAVKVRTELSTQIELALHTKRRKAPFPEDLYTRVLKSGTPLETVSVISNAKDNEVAALPPDALEALMGSLGQKIESTEPLVIQRAVDAQVRVMQGICGAIEKKGITLGSIMNFFELVMKFMGDQADQRVQVQRLLVLKELCELAFTELRTKGVGTLGTKGLGLLCQAAPFHIMILGMAGLGEKGEGDDVKAVALAIERLPTGVLEGLPAEILLKLATTCTKSKVVADAILPAVASACTAVLAGWSSDDVSKLALGLAKVKGGGESAQVAELYVKVAEVCSTNLASMSDLQLIKIVLALSRVDTCKDFVSTAAEEVVKKMETVQAALLLQVTLALSVLGGENASLAKMVDYWATAEAKLKELSGDQLGKMAHVLGPLMPSNEAFWKALGTRLYEQKASLTDAGKVSVGVAFYEGGGPAFEEKEKLMEYLKPKEKKEEKKRSRDRRDDRDRRDRDRRSRSRGGRDDRRRSRSRGGRDDRRRSRSRDRRR